MTQPWSPNPYADPRRYSGGSDQASASQATGYLNAQLNATYPNGSTENNNAYAGAPTGSFRTPYAQAAATGAGGQYGGYAGGYQDTRNSLLQAQQAAGRQAAPQANFGQAQAYLNELGGVQSGYNQNISALGQQAKTLQGIASGGQTAADTSFNAGMAQSAAAQRSAAASAAPGAAYSAAQRGGAANQGYAAQQGVAAKGELDYNQQMAAQQQLSQVQAQQAQALQGARGLAQGRVQGAQGIAEFNPQMQEGQNALNTEMQTGYNSSLLGMQMDQQQSGQTADVNASNYYLGLQGIQTAQQNQEIGAATGAGGAAFTGLSGYINSQSGPPGQSLSQQAGLNPNPY